MAAFIQSMIGNVSKGSLFAYLMSIGTKGTLTSGARAVIHGISTTITNLRKYLIMLHGTCVDFISCSKTKCKQLFQYDKAKSLKNLVEAMRKGLPNFLLIHVTVVFKGNNHLGNVLKK